MQQLTNKTSSLDLRHDDLEVDPKLDVADWQGAARIVAKATTQDISPWKAFLKEPALHLSIGVCVAILGGMVVNQLLRRLSCTGGMFFGTIRGSFQDWVWPACVTTALFLHSAWLYNVVLVGNFGHSKDYVVAILMGMATAWWGATYLYEVFYKATPQCEEEEVYTACDIFSDLSDTMFNVTVRFMMQAAMLCTLVHVAQEAVDSGSPTGLSEIRIVTNFIIALTLELYLFVTEGQHAAWVNLRRLYGVRAVMRVGKDVTGDKEVDIVRVAGGDYYVRFAMSVVVTGIFHKFLVLAYPLLVFTTFARDEWVVLLKDILAITIVVSLDNLQRPVPFKALRQYEDAAVEEEEAAGEEQED